MGRTSHTYNQRFLHNFYVALTEGDLPEYMATERKLLVQRSTGILQQMANEGLVFEDSLDQFKQKLAALGLEQYVEGLSNIYAGSGGVSGKA